MAPNYACPDCTTALTPGTLVRAPSFVCSACHGLLVNASSLREEYGPRALAALWESVRAESYTGKRSCPACGTAMRLFVVGAAHGDFALDVCAACKIFWFDSDELQKLGANRLARPREAPDPEAARALVEVQSQIRREEREFEDNVDLFLLVRIVADLLADMFRHRR